MIPFYKLSMALMLTMVFLFVTGVFVGGSSAQASVSSTRGTDFWITFDSNNSAAGDLRVYLSSSAAASVQIAWPDGQVTSHSVNANSVLAIEADVYADSYVNLATHGTAGNAIHITSDVPITVYGAHIQNATSDAFVAIPTASLGTTYRLLTHPQGQGHNRNRFSVIAAESGTTTVSITPTAALAGGATAGSTFSVSLTQGQVYTSQTASGGGSLDLSGTLIQADKEIVVTSSDNCANTRAGACDHVVQYMPPVTAWGSSFILPGSSNASSPDRYRVVADEANTEVRIDGSLVATLGAGGSYQFDPTGSNAQQTQLLETSKPALVGQFLGSGNFGGQTGDPAFSLISPTLQFLSFYNFATPASGFGFNTLTVVAKTADASSVSVAGVTLGSFTSVAGTAYSVSRTQITAGSYSISGDSGFGIYVAGFNSANSYSYPGGFAIVDLVANPGGVEEVEQAQAPPTPPSSPSSEGGSAPVTQAVQEPSPLPQRTRSPAVSLPGPVPSPVLQNNQLPTPPANASARVNGVPTQIQSLVTDPNNLSLRAGVFNIGINVQSNQGLVREGANGETEIQVRKGGVAGFEGTGLAPRTFIQVFMPLQGANAKEVARIPVDEAGSFSGEALFQTGLQDAPLPIGRQVLQMVMVDERGRQTVVELAVNIVQPAPAPEINRENGQTPRLSPGQSLATNAGVPEVVNLTLIPSEKQAIIDGDGWSMGVAPDSVGSSVVETDDGSVLLELVRDETATVSGFGFMPGTRADVWLFSDPTLLGTVEIDENGAFNGTVSIEGQVIAVGEHTLQLQGVGEDGYVRAANLGVLVNDAKSPASTDEAAGGLLWWLLALFAILTAAFLMYARARRRAS